MIWSVGFSGYSSALLRHTPGNRWEGSSPTLSAVSCRKDIENTPNPRQGSGWLRLAGVLGVGPCGLSAAWADGCMSAALGVDADSLTGAVGIYEQVGFRVTDTWGEQRKDLIGAS
jgi:hypothetical protein